MKLWLAHCNIICFRKTEQHWDRICKKRASITQIVNTRCWHYGCVMFGKLCACTEYDYCFVRPNDVRRPVRRRTSQHTARRIGHVWGLSVSHVIPARCPIWDGDRERARLQHTTHIHTPWRRHRLPRRRRRPCLAVALASCLATLALLVVCRVMLLSYTSRISISRWQPATAFVCGFVVCVVQVHK